jgi:predicted nucleic acid-binding protein
MIIHDTDVLSELMKRAPASVVVDWIAAQPVASLYTTSITQAEILHGIMVLPAGPRRRSLEVAATAMFVEEFGGRILGFNADAALPYARIASDRRRPAEHRHAEGRAPTRPGAPPRGPRA